VRARRASPRLASTPPAAATTTTTTTTTASPAEKVSPLFKYRTPLAVVFFVTARAFVVVAPFHIAATASRIVRVRALPLVAIVVSVAASTAVAAGSPAPVIVFVVAASNVAAAAPVVAEAAAFALAAIYVIVGAARSLAVSVKIIVPVITVSRHDLLLKYTRKIKVRSPAAARCEPAHRSGDKPPAGGPRPNTRRRRALFFDFKGNARDYKR
jgi:hypothetical protein